MLSEKTRVLVADDSALMRKIISDIINSDSELEVVATARNGQDALDKIKNYKPDIVTLDVQMPVMDGIATLERIMKESPLPVIMLSAYTQEGAEDTLRALESGALDFITKPGGSISIDISVLKEQIIEKIKTVAQVSVNKVLATEHNIPIKKEQAKHDEVAIKNAYKNKLKLVCIGTSTGGPKALYHVMSELHNDLNTAILIVQHMPQGFTKSLAQRLDSVSDYSVKEAENNDKVLAGHAYIAPGNKHMELFKDKDELIIQVNQKQPVNNHRPSVDVMFNSVAKVGLKSIVGVIMTGMGSDGALGLKELKKAGSINIGEDAETCVVYGMPKAAAKMGILDYEVPLYKIAEIVANVLTNK